ncbi:MAG: prepilin-type N-terminal cleavage/methylation domain-containing protein [Elusimicrobia bacterium]|jgi:prepilin-type N-terminal cleavage/methylation domain-containing protein|nr:prepilin-type N-terminal cleavage/methylation domain-containing protein [Elusimicrobiota bacterium]
MRKPKRLRVGGRSISKTKWGFTLIELMIVVAIIGVLAAIAIPKFADMVRRGKESAAKGQLGAVRSAISIYYADNEGVFPTVPLGFDRTELITTLTANTKYLQRWVPLSVPKHHGPVWTIDQVAHDDFFAIDAICDGEFVYVAPRTAAAWGKLAIECYHTDLKGSTWSTF